MSSPPPSVRYELRGPVAWLTINRPEARNALNQAVRHELFAGVRRFNDDEGAKVLVLTGAGEVAFCAGGDLKEMADQTLEVPPLASSHSLGATLTSRSRPLLRSMVSPTPAGSYWRRTATFALRPTRPVSRSLRRRSGQGAPWAAPLPWLIPPRAAMEILLTGEPVDARRAYELGLVNTVVPLEDLQETTQHLAERIASNAPLSVLAAKRTVGLITELPLEQAYAKAEEIWEPVYRSLDAQEGPAAFRDHRAPQWKGR